MIQVVNKYAGIPSGGHREYIGRPSVLGNPYKIGIDGDRAQVIQKFREHLDEVLKDPEHPVTRRISQLAIIARNGDLFLICFCAPQSCHGDVIKEAIERMNGLQDRTRNSLPIVGRCSGQDRRRPAATSFP